MTMVISRGGTRSPDWSIQDECNLKPLLKRCSSTFTRFFRLIGLNREIALIAGRFPSRFPGDPMDRVIAATVLAENLTPITSDRRILLASAVRTIW